MTIRREITLKRENNDMRNKNKKTKGRR